MAGTQADAAEYTPGPAARGRGAGAGARRGTAARAWWAGCAALAAAHPARGAAQAAPDSARGSAPDTATVQSAGAGRAPARAHGALAGAAATGGLILLGAAGAQAVHTPAAWPRTAGGFGRRVADQTGFYVLQTGTQRALAAGLGLRPDDAPCARRSLGPLVGCAVARSVTAVDRRGARRANVPFLASVGAATAASVLWRPERRSAGKAWGFVGTRLGVVLGSYAGERLLVEWRRGRGAAGPARGSA